MITYLYFRLCEYFKTKDTDLSWQKGRALIATSGIIVLNMATVLFFINSIFYKDQDLLNAILSGSHFIDKFLILPIIVSPIFLLVYYLGRKRLDDKIDYYRSEPTHVRKKKGIIVVLYIVLSVLLFQLSLASPLYIK